MCQIDASMCACVYSQLITQKRPQLTTFPDRMAYNPHGCPLIHPYYESRSQPETSYFSFPGQPSSLFPSPSAHEGDTYSSAKPARLSQRHSRPLPVRLTQYVVRGGVTSERLLLIV